MAVEKYYLAIKSRRQNNREIKRTQGFFLDIRQRFRAQPYKQIDKERLMILSGIVKPA